MSTNRVVRNARITNYHEFTSITIRGIDYPFHRLQERPANKHVHAASMNHTILFRQLCLYLHDALYQIIKK